MKYSAPGRGIIFNDEVAAPIQPVAVSQPAAPTIDPTAPAVVAPVVDPVITAPVVAPAPVQVAEPVSESFLQRVEDKICETLEKALPSEAAVIEKALGLHHSPEIIANPNPSPAPITNPQPHSITDKKA